MVTHLLSVWVACGIAAAAFLDWGVRLNLGRKRVTLGTVAMWVGAVLLPPAALLVGLVGMLVWAFGTLGQSDVPHLRVGRQWPDWWGRLRYRQHRAWRWAWYLGTPPVQEDWLSDWRDNVPARWKRRG